MIPLVVIRPEPGCAASLTGARAAGLEAFGFPLFVIQPRDWQPVPPQDIDALLIGSANALRHGGAALARYAHLPAHVVGEATAQTARAAGFTVVSTGAGGLQRVLDAVPAGTRLLRLTGEERVALSPPPGVSMVERVCYASLPVPMPPHLVRLLQRPAVVLLHSAEAARHFADECDRLGLERAGLALAALGPRIAEAAGSGWAMCQSASEPRETALLAIAAEMCQSCANDQG